MIKIAAAFGILRNPAPKLNILPIIFTKNALLSNDSMDNLNILTISIIIHYNLK
ncbi:hypothetical protein AAKU64_003187 [Undibacterium sp. GrIS 1.8]